MEEKKFSDVIIELRKKKGLTQATLAKKLNITDKAVSKWERGLSYPDITSISSLAKALDVDSSYLIDLCKKEDSTNPYSNKANINNIINLILNGIGIAMGISVVILNILNELETRDSIIMLGIGQFCLSLSIFQNKENNNL